MLLHVLQTLESQELFEVCYSSQAGTTNVLSLEVLQSFALGLQNKINLLIKSGKSNHISGIYLMFKSKSNSHLWKSMFVLASGVWFSSSFFFFSSCSSSTSWSLGHGRPLSA